MRLRAGIPPLLVAVTLLAACSQASALPNTQPQTGGVHNGPFSPDPASDPSGVATIRTINPQFLGWDELVAAFTDTHPNIRIEQDPVPEDPDAYNALPQQIEGGKYDVVPLNAVASRVNLLDLGPYVQKSGFDLAPFGGLPDGLREDGKLNQLPYEVHPRVLWANPEQFKAAGLDLPMNGWTWDEFRQAAHKLTQGQGDQKVWGVASDVPQRLLDSWIAQMPDGFVGAQEADLRQVLTAFHGMIADGVMPPAVHRERGKPYSLPTNPFLQGRAALADLSPSYLTKSSSIEVPWGIVPPPTLPGRHVYSVGYSSLGIPAAGHHPDAAWEFIRYVTGPEGAVVAASAGRVPAYRTAEARQAWFDRTPKPPAGTAFFFEGTWTVERWDGLPEKLRQAFDDATGPVLEGTEDVDSALAKYLREAQRIRAESNAQ